MVQTATLLTRGLFNQTRAKTAHGLIRYGKKFKINSVIDETLAGLDAGEVMGIGNKGIPIISEVDTTAAVLIIGVAPSGGKLPHTWRIDIIKAIKNGMDVISGLHEFLNDDIEFKNLAKKYDVKLIDIRKPPDDLTIAKGIKPTIPIILIAGTDGRSGKRTTALELYHFALDKGYNAGFIATGQTGIMIGCDAGVAVDHLEPQYVSGAIEKSVQELIAQNKDFIFVEGQSALLHHAYSTSAIGILHGAKPMLIIISHNTTRTYRASFPKINMPPVEDEINAIEHLSPESRIIALSLNTKGAADYLDICKEYEARTGLISVDVFADNSGTRKLFEKIRTKLTL
jgi:uncharacterized NAD-dependent epimerase/dehydratase family protein